MIGQRLSASGHYIERPRLLAALPRSAESVAWLEAPYGYGKSVLASQWLASLEADGWLGAWLARPGSDLVPALARLLGLPAAAPWPLVHEHLWSRPTALVLDDLTGEEPLGTLLASVGGALLLASRGPLPSAELPRLRTAGRLTRLGATELAFTVTETRRLSGMEERAEAAWRETDGWPLPLHFAALTGEGPRLEDLADGLRASVDQEAWAEALLLAAVDSLPADLATAATGRLATTGFAQALEQGVRLHQLVAEALRRAAADEQRAVVAAFAPRLPPRLRAEAFEAAGCHEELAALLEDTHAELDRGDPRALLRWHRLAPGPVGPVRRAVVGTALCLTGAEAAGLEQLEEAAGAAAGNQTAGNQTAGTEPAGRAASGARERGDLSPDERLVVLGHAVWFLARAGLLDEARDAAAAGEALLATARPERAGRFLNNVSYIHFQAGDYAAAAELVERALAYYPTDSPLRFGPLTNLAVLAWNLSGDLERRLALQGEAMRSSRELTDPESLAAACRDTARMHLLLGQRAAARELLEEALATVGPVPTVGLEARARLAELDGDSAAFERLAADVAAWVDPYATDVVVAAWLRTAVALGLAHEARRVANDHAPGAGALARIERALWLAADGDPRAAEAELAEVRDAYPNREYRLAWQAAAFRVGGDEARLEELLALTTAGARVLPGLVPLASLPRGRPELARHYPLAEVLDADWQAAVQDRLGEVPPVEVDLLGRFEVRVVGREVNLPLRCREILVLLLLGRSRDEIGLDLWPDASREKVKNNLAVQFASLRKSLEPWRVPTYLFDDGLRRVDSDVLRLHQSLQRGDAAAVYAVYREPFAPGVAVPPVAEHGENLRQRAITVLTAAAEAAPLEDALAWLERVLELEPFHEAALRSSLALLVRSGRRHEAQRRLEAFRSRLWDEAGLEPLPETVSVLGGA